MKHLIDIERLSKEELLTILQTADQFLSLDKKNNRVQYQHSELLKYKTIYNLFYEPSTRTRVSFELAAKNLGARVINLDVGNSSVTKGESLRDTILTLKSLQADAIIVRHSENDTAEFISEICEDATTVINAGNGIMTHPTQALLDVYTILKHKPNIADLKISIIGDVLHSRVARSQIVALIKLGCQNINIIAPENLLPEPPAYFKNNVTIHSNLEDGLQDSDVICCLRLQKERMKHTLILDEQEFFNTYGITKKTIQYAKPDAILMHPGPINRDIEISGEVAYGKQSVILEQVTNGVAIRMAVLALTCQ